MTNNRYILISPVRNEEEFIKKTIESVIKQTILPIEWVIVNDGSDDNTPQILNKYSKRFSWIKIIDRPRQGHRPGLGVVLAFNQGFDSMDSEDFDFIVKLDGDLSFDPDYFEFLLQEFEENPKLGLASGTTYNVKGKKLIVDKMPEDHVRGAAKMYRRECFDDIGGLALVLGWDTIDELKAQLNGWETRSYKNLILKHYKPIGFKQEKTLRKELLAGERLHFMGYHPLFATLKCIYEFKNKPWILRGSLMLIGYFEAIVFRRETYNDQEITNYLKKKQLTRLKRMFSL